jgi:hypothetical protein
MIDDFGPRIIARRAGIEEGRHTFVKNFRREVRSAADQDQWKSCSS